MITISQKAKEKIIQILKEQNGNQESYLRIYVVPSGCCGLDFAIEVTNETDSADNFIDMQDFKLVVDDFSYPFIENLAIDLVEKEGKEYFVLNINKQYENSCNCNCNCGCDCK